MCLCCRQEPDGDGSGKTPVPQYFSLRFLLILLIRGYQYCLSPLFPPACRFTPSCSQYAIDALSRYGVVRGVPKALWRIARCHPFARGGYDPVK